MEEQLSLKLRFGKLISIQKEPGLMFKWPWPMERIQTIELRKRLFKSEEEQVLTQDKNSLILSNHVIWSVHPDHGERFFTSLSDREFDPLLESQLRSLRNGAIGSHDFSDLFSTDETFSKVESQLKADLAKYCLEHFGVHIHDVGFTQLGLAPAVLESVYEKMNAERQRYATTLRGKSEAEANRIEVESQAAFDKEMAEAKGEAQRILGQAEADSIEAFEFLSKHRDIALKLKKLESLKALLKDRSTIVLDRNTAPLDMLKGTGVE
jgi:membrane protease subunit HflC